MIYKYSLKMNIDYINDKNEVVSTGSILVGKSNNKNHIKDMMNDMKYTKVSSHVGYSDGGNIYQDKKIRSIPYQLYNASMKQTIREQINSIEIIEN